MDHIKRKRIQVNGEPVSFMESTGKSEHDFIFVPGNSTSAESFKHIFEEKFATQHRLMCFDWPSSLQRPFSTTEAEAFYSPNGIAHFVKDFCKAAGVNAPVLVGWSLGGNSVIEGIGQGLYNDAAGFVVYGAPPMGKPPAQNAFFPNPAMAVAFAPEMSRENAEALAAAYLSPGAKVPSFFVDDILNADPQSRPSLAKSLFGMAYIDQLEIVSKLTKPFAVFHGQKEQLVNLEYLKEVTIPTLWQHQVQVIPNAGHATHFENAPEFTRKLEAFFNAEIKGRHTHSRVA